MVSEKYFLCLQNWSGITQHEVELVGETPKKYRIKLLSDIMLPGGKYRFSGDIILVPKYSVKIGVT